MLFVRHIQSVQRRARRHVIAVLIGLLLIVAAGPGTARASLHIHEFTNITANSLVDAMIGETQFRMEVVDVPSLNQAVFKFLNIGPEPSSITDVYFDGDALVGSAVLTGSSGVLFTVGAKPKNLPGKNSVSPQFAADLSFDSAPPVQPNGVNPGEWLQILFDLYSTEALENVMADLSKGSLRVGIHTQGFAGGGSESFVNRLPVLPAPGALLLGGIGLVCLAGRRPR